MTRKLSVSLALALLFTAFATISFLVIITRRHPFWVEKKLRIGALILTLSPFTAGCRGIGPEITCYDPAAPNEIIVDKVNYQTDTVTVSKAANPAISGTIQLRTGSAFSYSITDPSRSFSFEENIQPQDGAFDESTEEFTIPIPPAVTPGDYLLRFYDTPKDSIAQSRWPLRTFNLVVTE